MSTSNDSNARSISPEIPPQHGSSRHKRSDIATADVKSTGRPEVPFFKRQYVSFRARKSVVDNDEQVDRGPLGLRLLHASPESLIDIIFVHGLRGGSTKTWRKGSDPRNFWPQFWLPAEPDLQNASIHSFGYDSDWVSTKSSILNVDDFGQSLLEEMRNSPHLRDNRNKPIILVGHSMGGLVIKKAFVLANEILELQQRLRCIFFLATPHRGSDYAALLNNILTISGIMPSRHYISDITIGSKSAPLINKDFGKCASDLPIFSFYETLQTKLGFSSNLIVEKSSAILGPDFRRERVQYLNANHRDICKFDSLDDSNYVTLKNAIIGVTEAILKDGIKGTMQELKDPTKILQLYLGITDQLDENYSRVKGSCQWIDHRPDFQAWKDTTTEPIYDGSSPGPVENLAMFWVVANPGTGKTYLAAYVNGELNRSQFECSHFFFHIDNTVSNHLGHCLRSIALQMAMSNAQICDKVLDLYQKESTFDKDDAATIWAKVFMQGIFKARTKTPQYWVIDAIDECSKYRQFFDLIKGIRVSFPLRIFITSRNILELQRADHSLKTSMSMYCIEIPEEESTRDIDIYIQERVRNLATDLDDDKQTIVETLRSRSSTSFLWARLILDELEKVHTMEGVTHVLETVPEGMSSFYERTVRALFENSLEKQTTQAVLLWTVASLRDLYLQELAHALKLDIDTVLPSTKSAVEALCGQMVFVDQRSGMVRLVHTTLREFLLSKSVGEFHIAKPRANERLALTCLKLLSSGEMKPPRSHRTLSQAQKKEEPSPLINYAIIHFSEHVSLASADSDELLLAVDLFLKKNVLSWIERIARLGDLYPLLRASKNLKAYLGQRSKKNPLLTRQEKDIESWTTDLNRIVTMFGPALLQDPSSIYFTIPPFSPLESAIYRRFAKRSAPLELSIGGHTAQKWSDCVAAIDFENESTVAAVSCGNNFIAIAMTSRHINIYNWRTCQKEGTITQDHPIDLLRFTDKALAICTTRSVVLVDYNGNTIWQTRFRFRCILLSSSTDTVFAVSEHGHVFKWDILDGALLQDQRFENIDPGEDPEHAPSIKAPETASLSPDMKTLALSYRGGAVFIFESENGEIIALPRDKSEKPAPVLLFNPNPSISLLLVIYMDHELVLYDTDTWTLIWAQATSRPAGILAASSSPDGKTLATVDKRGTLQIWDFQSLDLLYHVTSPETSFRILDFVSDGSSVVDVTDSGMRLWNPSALIRKTVDEDPKFSDDVLTLTATEGEYEKQRTSRITALCSHPSLPLIFAGKHNGQVMAFDAKTGMQRKVVYTHPENAIIRKLAVSKDNIIASGDANCTVQIWELRSNYSSAHLYSYASTHIKGPIRQLIFTARGNHLLVSTDHTDQVYFMEDGSCVGSMSFEHRKRNVWKWLEIPSPDEESDRLALICDHKLTKFSASYFPLEIDGSKTDLPYKIGDGNSEVDINSAIIHTKEQTLALEIRYTSCGLLSSSVFFFNLSKKTLMSDLLPVHYKNLIGMNQRTQSFVFLHRNSWICSTNFAEHPVDHYAQHFYVPIDYLWAGHDVLPVLTADQNVAFCLHDELAVVVNGLKFKEMKVVN